MKIGYSDVRKKSNLLPYKIIGYEYYMLKAERRLPLENYKTNDADIHYAPVGDLMGFFYDGLV